MPKKIPNGPLYMSHESFVLGRYPAFYFIMFSAFTITTIFKNALDSSYVLGYKCSIRVNLFCLHPYGIP